MAVKVSAAMAEQIAASNKLVMDSILVLLMYLYKCMGTCLNYLSSFVTWEILIAYLGWMLERKQVSLHVHEQAEFGSMQMKMMNQNNCLGVAAMLYAIFEQFRELNLNHSRLQLSM